MYLRKSKRKCGKSYVQIVEPYRENGKNKAKCICLLGYLEDLMLEHPDIEVWLEEVPAEKKKEYSGVADSLHVKNYTDVRVYHEEIHVEKPRVRISKKYLWKTRNKRIFQ